MTNSTAYPSKMLATTDAVAVLTITINGIDNNLPPTASNNTDPVTTNEDTAHTIIRSQ